MPAILPVGEEEDVVEGHVGGVGNRDLVEVGPVTARFPDRKDDIAVTGLGLLVGEDPGELCGRRQVHVATVSARLDD